MKILFYGLGDGGLASALVFLDKKNSLTNSPHMRPQIQKLWVGSSDGIL